MGYIAHHTIVVEGWEDKIREAHAKARAIFGERVSEIATGGVNGSESFFVPPDGSKEGWDTSDEWDEKRAAFVRWIREHPHLALDWIEVRFGGDDAHRPAIESHSADGYDD